MIKLNKVNYTWCNFTSPCLMLFKLQYEVQVLRSLSHPNILPFYCSFVTQQEVWHVLPLMQFGMFLPYDYTCTFFKSIQGCASRKIEGSPHALNLCWSKLRFPSHLRANVECRGPPYIAGAQPCHSANRVSLCAVLPFRWSQGFVMCSLPTRQATRP